jgi:uncharacterized protein YbdZ (MbtH family)
MSADTPRDLYEVVVNHEEQYSIWPSIRELPRGWIAVGKRGTKEECLDYIELTWTDMRPLSVRRQLERLAELPPEDDGEEAEGGEPTADPLVEFLSQGEHPVEVLIRPETTRQAFIECLKRGFVHVNFLDTRGGTELGLRVGRDAYEVNRAVLERGEGRIQLTAGLTLNFERVRCVVDIDVAGLRGEGHLVAQVGDGGDRAARSGPIHHEPGGIR